MTIGRIELVLELLTLGTDLVSDNLVTGVKEREFWDSVKSFTISVAPVVLVLLGTFVKLVVDTTS